MFGKPANLTPVVEKVASQSTKKVAQSGLEIDSLSEQIARLTRQKEYYAKRGRLAEEAAVIALKLTDLDNEYADVR